MGQDRLHRPRLSLLLMLMPAPLSLSLVGRASCLHPVTPDEEDVEAALESCDAETRGGEHICGLGRGDGG